MAQDMQDAGNVSAELDAMVCDLIGAFLDDLAAGENPGVVVAIEDAASNRYLAALDEDGEEACLEAATNFISEHKMGLKDEGLGRIARYAIGYTGCVEIDGEDAVLDLLVGTEGVRGTQELIDHRRLAVVDVGDDGDVPQIVYAHVVPLSSIHIQTARVCGPPSDATLSGNIEPFTENSFILAILDKRGFLTCRFRVAPHKTIAGTHGTKKIQIVLIKEAECLIFRKTDSKLPWAFPGIHLTHFSQCIHFSFHLFSYCTGSSWLT